MRFFFLHQRNFLNGNSNIISHQLQASEKTDNILGY